MQDLRYGFRALRRSPGLTLAAVLSLAAGIGANSTIFSFIDAIFTRPMHVPRVSEMASGCNSVELGHRFLIQALNVVGRDEAKGDLLGQVEVASAFLASVGPAADAIEGALATQLLGLHATAMRCLAGEASTPPGRAVPARHPEDLR